MQHLLILAFVTTIASSEVHVVFDRRGFGYLEKHGCITVHAAIKMTIADPNLNSARTICRNLQSGDEEFETSFEYIHTCWHEMVPHCCKRRMRYPWSCTDDLHSVSPRIHKKNVVPARLPPLPAASGHKYNSPRNNGHHHSQKVNPVSGSRLEPLLQKRAAQPRHAVPEHDHDHDFAANY